jgi:purine nucleoside phosphorylase
MMAGIERVIVTGAIGGILPEIEKVYSVLGAETVNELLDDASLAGKRLLVP